MREPRPWALTIPVPLDPWLHPLQFWGHQQRALECDSLAFRPKGDPKLLQELDIKVHVGGHSSQGHCTERADTIRARSRPPESHPWAPEPSTLPIAWAATSGPHSPHSKMGSITASAPHVPMGHSCPWADQEVGPGEGLGGFTSLQCCWACVSTLTRAKHIAEGGIVGTAPTAPWVR